MIRKAERSKRSLRACLEGSAGSGKTHSALLIASGLVSNGGKIVVIDTENSADLEEGKPEIPEFHVLPVTAPYSPEKFMSAMTECLRSGAEVVIVDTLSHAWEGEGGILEMKQKAGSDWGAWSKVMPSHNKMRHKLTSFPLHLIVNLRTKTEWAQETYQKQNGQQGVKPVKLGLKPCQKDGMEYEFDLVFRLKQETHETSVSKDRTSLFDGKDSFVPSAETGKQLLDWLNAGTGESPIIQFQKSLEKFEEVKTQVDGFETLGELTEFYKAHKIELQRELTPDHWIEFLNYCGQKKTEFQAVTSSLAWLKFAETELKKCAAIQAVDDWVMKNERNIMANLTNDFKDQYCQLADDIRDSFRNNSLSEEQWNLVNKTLESNLITDTEKKRTRAFLSNPDKTTVAKEECIDKMMNALEARRQDEARISEPNHRKLLSCIHCKNGESCNRCELINSLPTDSNMCLDGSGLTAEQWDITEYWKEPDDGGAGLSHEAVTCKCGKIWIRNYSAGRIQGGATVCPWKIVKSEFGEEPEYLCPECETPETDKTEALITINQQRDIDRCLDYYEIKGDMADDFLSHVEEKTGLSRNTEQFALELIPRFSGYLESWGKLAN